MNDFIELCQAGYMVVKSMLLLLYVYLALFFLVHLFGAPSAFHRVASNAVHELDRISAEAKRRSEA